MNKGIWARNLFQKTIAHKISLGDSLKLFLDRFRRKPLILNVFGIEFTQVDHILWSIVMDIFVNDIYTPPGFDIHESDMVVDIGAHQGVFSAYAALRTKGIIRAYEPNSLNYERLCGFVRRNHLNHVETYRYAIAAESGERNLLISGTTSTHYLIPLDQKPDLLSRSTEKIQTRALDSHSWGMLHSRLD